LSFVDDQGVPSSCLELSWFSTYETQQLQRITPSELATPTPADRCGRYAVSNTPLPADRCSYWAAVTTANTWYIVVGVIADKDVKHHNGSFNFDHPTFCGVQVFHDGKQAWVRKNGQGFGEREMAGVAGDVLLFRLDPLQRQLTIVNSRTRQTTVITNVVHDDPEKPLYLTVTISSSLNYGPISQVELRQVTGTERAMLAE
jgi:hypothetical protein